MEMKSIFNFIQRRARTAPQRQLSLHLRFKLRQSICLVVVFACTALALASPGQIASLRGTVSDPTGAVVPGAKVRARNLSTGALLEATTGPEGGYSISLPAGRYDLEFSESGFQPSVRKAVDVAAGAAVALDVQLPLATQTEIAERHRGSARH